MDDFISDVDVQWMREGISYAKRYSDYPYKDSLHRVESTEAIAKLPRIIVDSGRDATPKPLFPIFLLAAAAKEKAAAAAADADGTHETTEAASKIPASVRDDSELEGLEAFVFQEEEQEEHRILRKQSREEQRKRAQEELVQMWSEPVEEGDETWKQVVGLLLPPVEESEEHRVSVVVDEGHGTEPVSARDEFPEQDDLRGGGSSGDAKNTELQDGSVLDEDEEVGLEGEDVKPESLESLKDEEVEEYPQVKDEEAYYKEWEEVTEKLRSIVYPKHHAHRRPTHEADEAAEPDSVGAGFEEEFDAVSVQSEILPLDHHVPVEFSRKNIFVSETDTILQLDQPDITVMPDWPEYQKVVDRNDEYERALQRNREDGTSANASVQTFNPEQMDRHVYTGPLPALTESDGMIDEYCLYETYVKEPAEATEEEKSRDETALVKGIELNDYESFIRYLDTNEKQFMPVLYYFEKTMNQNSYGELLAACIEPESGLDAAVPEDGEDYDPLTTTCPLPNVRHLLAIYADVFRGKKHSVTYICFNYKYPHYFAAGFDETPRERGGYDSAAPPGHVICWDMQHFQVPEVYYQTPEVVTCAEFSRVNPCLLAVGMRRGLLAVFDISNPGNEPAASNYCSIERPYGDISRVRWLDRRSEDKRNPSLVCVTTDGKLYQWSPGSASRLTPLRGGEIRSRAPERGAGDHVDEVLPVNTPYLCLDLNPTDPNVFVAGTVTGEILQCDLSGQLILKHVKHCGPVYEVRWSRLVDNIFMSCGFDSAICLWDASKPEPERVFYAHQREPVLRICWSNTSSTLFAAVTASRIKIYDLSQSRVGELLEHDIQNPDEELTCVMFFPYGNWFFVGRSDGVIDVFEVRNVALSHEDPKNALKSAFLK